MDNYRELIIDSTSVYKNYLIDSIDICQKKINISVLIMTYNEERCIERCIRSVNALADEIIVCDTGSTDRTIDKIKHLENSKIILIEEKWKDDFSFIRNKLIDNAKNDWVFIIDADEYLENVEEKKIFSLIRFIDSIDVSPKIISPKLRNVDGSVLYMTQRIFKKNKHLKYVGYVHEELRFKNKFDMPYICIDIPFFHDGYEKKIVESKNKNMRNFRLLEKMKIVEPDNLRWTYFLAREMLVSNFENAQIEELIVRDLNVSNQNLPFIKSGLYTILMQLNLNDKKKFKEFSNLAKKNKQNNLDIYYLEILKYYNDIMFEVNNNLVENENLVISLDETPSFIHSEGDHIFFIWGKVHFMMQNYDQAFLYWDKIQDYEMKEDIKKELVTLSNNINHYLNFNQ